MPHFPFKGTAPPKEKMTTLSHSRPQKSTLARQENCRNVGEPTYFYDRYGIIHTINREERLSIMEIKKIAFFETKPYDKESFDRLKGASKDLCVPPTFSACLSRSHIL